MASDREYIERGEGVGRPLRKVGGADARDAILAADVAPTGGQDHCRIWKAFARRGLGLSASQGSSNSRADGVQAFDYPSTC